MAMASSVSNQSANSELRSMSKWTKAVSSTTMALMMAVAIICVIPAAIEGKSLYVGGGGGEENVAASAARAQHEAGALGGLDHERQQQLAAGNEMADLIDYGGVGNRDHDRDEYDGGMPFAALPVENPLLNYLYSRQMLQRLRPAAAAIQQPSAFLDQSYPPYAASYYLSPAQAQQPIDAWKRKRTSTYWKQCAFNAVSCFGK